MFLVAALFVILLAIDVGWLVRSRFGLSSSWRRPKMSWLKIGRLIRSRRQLSFPILQLTVSQAMVGVVLALAPALSLAVLHRPLQDASQFLIIPAGYRDGGGGIDHWQLGGTFY